MHRCRLSFLALGLALALAQAARSQFFLPPGVLNPGAHGDGADDLFASHVIGPDLTIHAVWFSQVDYTGSSGGDPDLFYSRLPPGGAWSAPELVNTYGTSDDGADERNPRLVVDGGGVVHCVWQSQYGLGGAGSDWDVLYARRTSGGWQPAEFVNGAIFDLALAVDSQGRLHAVWSSRRPGDGAPSSGSDLALLDGTPVVGWDSNASVFQLGGKTNCTDLGKFSG